MPFTNQLDTVAAVKAQNLPKDHQGNALLKTDLNQTDFIKYLNSMFPNAVVGKMFYEVFQNGSNTTVSAAYDVIAAYAAALTPADFPVGGQFLNMPAVEIMWHFCNACRAARGRHNYPGIDTGI